MYYMDRHLFACKMNTEQCQRLLHINSLWPRVRVGLETTSFICMASYLVVRWNYSCLVNFHFESPLLSKNDIKLHRRIEYSSKTHCSLSIYSHSFCAKKIYLSKKYLFSSLTSWPSQEDKKRHWGKTQRERKLQLLPRGNKHPRDAGFIHITSASLK